MRAAVGDWRPPREPELGSWQDDRDDELAARVAAAGWAELWAGDELLGAVVAGRHRARARSRAVSASSTRPRSERRSGSTGGRGTVARLRRSPSRRGPAASASARLSSGGRPEITLDGSGTVQVDVTATGELEPIAAVACWRAWNAATLAYVAGLAQRSLELAVEHARARVQFGAPLSALPGRPGAARRCGSGRRRASSCSRGRRRPTRAGSRSRSCAGPASACCDVTAAAHQVHGAVGFALETGLHVYHRRARSVQAWTAAACAAAR